MKDTQFSGGEFHSKNVYWVSTEIAQYNLLENCMNICSAFLYETDRQIHTHTHTHKEIEIWQIRTEEIEKENKHLWPKNLNKQEELSQDAAAEEFADT